MSSTDPYTPNFSPRACIDVASEAIPLGNLLVSGLILLVVGSRPVMLLQVSSKIDSDALHDLNFRSGHTDVDVLITHGSKPKRDHAMSKVEH